VSAGTPAWTTQSGFDVRLGWGDDVGWAAALNVSSCVPVLGADGAYVADVAASGVR
jgi:hypothetical protein